MISAEQLWRAVGMATLMGFSYAHALRWTVTTIKRKWAGDDLWDNAGETMYWFCLSWFAAVGMTLATILAMSVPAK